MQLHRVEELRPFGCDSGVGHVACDQDDIERVRFVDRFDAVEDTREAVIAARTAAPAFDAESVALADQMDV
jgi:hypothetical protein